MVAIAKDDRWSEQIQGESMSGHCLPSTAYHEAGHAVVCRMLGVAVEKVSVMPTSLRLGFTAHADDGHLPKRAQAMVLLAGIVAEQTFLQGHPYPILFGQSDVIAAMRLLATPSGLLLTLDETPDTISGVERGLQDLFDPDHRPCYWRAVRALAATLLKRGEILGCVAEAIIDKALREKPGDSIVAPRVAIFGALARPRDARSHGSERSWRIS